MRFLFLGAPGSGKGTISEMVVKKYGMSTFSTGDLLRHAIRSGSDVGKRSKALVDQGKLVPDAIVSELVEGELRKLGAAAGWILDGYPRNVAQAGDLEGLLARLKQPLTAVFSIEVPFEEIVKRLAGRRVHAASGRTYHLEFKPPKVAEKDDETGEPLTQRDDDRAEVVLSRLRLFQEVTAPLLDFYAKKSLLLRIDSPNSPTGFARVAAIVDKRFVGNNK